MKRQNDTTLKENSCVRVEGPTYMSEISVEEENSRKNEVDEASKNNTHCDVDW